ncbi:PASTA domain-containing protein [Fulvivirga sp. M361]|uniref:PASTA domain-containing protein n=1 Tax=Fulvivirga sp. M361 TaxID=2594266 RepID=UPI00117BDC97|nr:PASTA domain-containing protein [Fulvivirga sp. M361]TRX61698.1 PASTA domain-containing protein [Fulvivirga sp. M361]
MKLNTGSLKNFGIHIIIVIIVMAVATLLFFYSYLPLVTNKGESITVPDLHGLNMKDIDDFITKRNLRYEINDSTYSDEHPPLTILKQYPKPGSKVKENRKIFISVNRVTPPNVPFPHQLIGSSSLKGAEAVLKSTELKPGKILYKPSPFFDLVLDMKWNGKSLKEGDMIPKGSVIDLIAGDGHAARNFKAPKLVGLELEEALFYIKGVRLATGIITVENDTTEQKSFVIKQHPGEGQNVQLGDLVDLWIVPETDSLYQLLFQSEETDGSLDQ